MNREVTHAHASTQRQFRRAKFLHRMHPLRTDAELARHRRRSVPDPGTQLFHHSTMDVQIQ